MDTTDAEIAQRWRLYRRARERGMSEVDAYDRYLHPRSRIESDELAQELDRTGPD